MASTCGSKRRHPSSDSSGFDQDCLSSSKSYHSANLLKRGQEKETKMDMTGGEDTKRLLKCPICFEVLVSPIYQCPDGHIICKTCKPKLANCPSCEKPIGIIRNLALECILETVTFPCNHRHKGCQVFFNIQDLQKHIEECDHRPLKCHLHRQDGCNKTSLYLDDTVRHLAVVHNHITVGDNPGHPNVFTSGNYVNWNFPNDAYDDDDGSIHFIYPSEAFHFDNNVFVAVIRTEKLFTYFGFYLVGSKEDATKYRVTITVEDKRLHDGVFRLESTTRILSIQEFQAKVSIPNVPLP